MSQDCNVVFIHGLANKPEPVQLKRIWLDALAEPHGGDDGFDLAESGVSNSFIYWADLFYDEPLPASDYESRSGELERSVSQDFELIENEWTQSMMQRFAIDEADDEGLPEMGEVDAFERIPVPWILKKRLIKRLVKETHDYLFNVDGIRDTIRQRVVDALNAVQDDTRRVIVGHSQGTFIAYDVLKSDPRCPDVSGLMTIGSPLGVDEIQDKLEWSRDDGFPERLKGDWVNVYDPYDVVSRLDPKLANDFKRNGEAVITDVKEENWGTWRHSATKYFKGSTLRSHLRRICDRDDD